MMSAARDNDGKAHLAELSWFGVALDRLADHMMLGRAKYPDVGLTKGTGLSETAYNKPNFLLGNKPDEEYLSAIVRHVGCIHRGEVHDPEGFRHDAAIAWNALALSVNNYPEDQPVGFAYDGAGAIMEWPDDEPLPDGPPLPPGKGGTKKKKNTNNKGSTT